MAKSWDEGAIHIEQLSFTGETWEGVKVRGFALSRDCARARRETAGHAASAWGRANRFARLGALLGGARLRLRKPRFCDSGPGRATRKPVTQWGPAPTWRIPAGRAAACTRRRRFEFVVPLDPGGAARAHVAGATPADRSRTPRGLRHLRRWDPDLDGGGLRCSGAGRGTDLWRQGRTPTPSVAVAGRRGG